MADTCRFAHDPHHRCRNVDGRTPPRPGTLCFDESRARLFDAVRSPRLDRDEAREVADHDGEAAAAWAEFVAGHAS